MKTEVLYLILDHLGNSRLVRDQTTEAGKPRLVRDHATEPVSLSDLLADGWRPVRETPFSSHPSSPSQVLILLERESDETFGFGFGKKL